MVYIISDRFKDVYWPPSYLPNIVGNINNVPKAEKKRLDENKKYRQLVKKELVGNFFFTKNCTKRSQVSETLSTFL